jgi:hypothetical protein
MPVRMLTATVFSLGAAVVFGTPAMAADLPQSGSIKVHSTLKTNGQVVDVGEKHIMGAGSGWGVTFNDAGSGPLHMGAWMCTYTFQNVSNPLQVGGACEFGDAGGADKIFITFSGTGTESVGTQGSGTIIGGIGKFAGVQGKMSFQCKDIDPAQGLETCTQQFDYQLMAMSSTK